MSKNLRHSANGLRETRSRPRADGFEHRNVCGIVGEWMWVTAGAELLCSGFKRGVQEISSRHPPRWRRGREEEEEEEEDEIKAPFPALLAEAAAGRVEALNWLLSICSAWEE